MKKFSTLIKKTILPFSGALVTVIGIATPLQAHSLQSLRGWDVGLMGGTLGLLGEVGYRFNPTFGIRAHGGGCKYYINELKYAGDKYHHIRFHARTLHFLADWYFLTTWWRLTGGLGLNWSRIHVKRDMTNEPFPENLGGIVTLRYRYKNRVTTYVGTGVDFFSIPCGGKDSKFIFSLDVGMNYQGDVKVRVRLSGEARNIPLAMQIAHKKGSKLLNQNWWVRYYPVANLSIRYKI